LQPQGGGSGTGGVAAVDGSSTSSPSLSPSRAGLPELGNQGNWGWQVVVKNQSTFLSPFWEGRFFLVLSIFFLEIGGLGSTTQVSIINGTLVVWDSRGSIK